MKRRIALLGLALLSSAALACGSGDEAAVKQTAEKWVAAQFSGSDKVCQLEMDLSPYAKAAQWGDGADISTPRSFLLSGCKMSYDPGASEGARRTGRPPTRGEIASELAYVLDGTSVDVSGDEARIAGDKHGHIVIVLRRIDHRWQIDAAHSNIGFTSAIPPEPPT